MRKSGDEFYHELLPAAIVHPDLKRALPLDLEPITRRDGKTKNDCERNAGKRLLNSIRQQFPFLEYWESDKKSKQMIFAWVTSLSISAANTYSMASSFSAARAVV